jgi:hypothetical protein
MMILAQSSLPIDISTFVKDPEIALLILLLILALVGSYKGWWIPGPIYKKEVDRGDLVTKYLGETTKSIESLTEEIRQRG